jgi:hypothetical protein
MSTENQDETLESTPQESQETSTIDFVVHPTIDVILARDKSRRAKSDDPGWKYAWWPDLTDKNKIQCMLCGKITKGGIKRQKEHLIGGYSDVGQCSKTTTTIMAEMRLWLSRSKKRKIDALYHPVKEVGGSTQAISEEPKKSAPSSSSGIPSKEGKKIGPLDVMCKDNLKTFVLERRQRLRGGQQTVIEDHFKKKEKEMIDNFFCDFLYECGLPFNLITKLSLEILCEAIGYYGRSYKPPSLHQVRKPLLEKKYNDVTTIRSELEVHWRKYGVTLMTDGWTDRRQRSIVNFLCNCPEGTFYLYSIDTSAHEKTASYLLNLIEDAITEVGEANVVQVCTDNAANYVLAGYYIFFHPKLVLAFY